LLPVLFKYQQYLKNVINLKIVKILKFSGKNKEIETKEEEHQPGAGDPQILVFNALLIKHGWIFKGTVQRDFLLQVFFS
jgi:hypothetical protein